MPLYKRKPFTLMDPPKDLDADESIFQIRFTKELFRDYEEYLKRLNLYRQRVWTCRVSGKSNLTYEEALVSEHHATEKVQEFPKDFIAPVLQMIQFSIANLTDLVNELYDKLQDSLFEGLELQGKKDDSVCSCKILKALYDGDTFQYKVDWIDKEKKVFDSTIVKAEDLIHKRRPFSRRVLREFIKESTYQNFPWVVHEKLAKKYGIFTEPPEELRDKLTLQNGSVWSFKKFNKADIANGGEIGNGILAALEKEMKKDRIRYPIDDLLVRPAHDDPTFTERPPLSLEFNVPMECVGDLLMVWDFCCTFGKLLHLYPFTLDDLENAICHKDTNLILIMELHSSILHLIIMDEGKYFLAIQNKKRKTKIKQSNWVEFLSEFLEMEDRECNSTCVGTIKRGHYGLLEVHSKLQILRELVAEALETNAIRDKLDERFEQQQALEAVKREEARKKKEELLKMVNSDLEAKEGNIMENGSSNGHIPSLNEINVNHSEEVYLPDKNQIAENGEKKRHSSILESAAKRQRVDDELHTKSARGQRRTKDKDKETHEKKPVTMGEHLEREIEKLSGRTNSLGKDRNYNRYWFFRREGRIFVENSDSTQWGYYSTKDELDALLGSLNPKGERERGLKRQLEKHYNKISSALQKRSKDITHRLQLEENILRRSVRVRAQPRDSSTTGFLRYINKWKGL
ncbi:DDT domain-containing protein DDB_G0282237-like [Zingiber officinale]|uniref:DDT domain-containing protein n=1 Tax=Zingiber officinale TaxID=94328 RepID=A0A8J5G820_ZINOF|nr:DDT domain-containing protein DDB_G0282237-like [Zingiber officinale]KAG6499672.1 hypothetical protein ZIOFF_039463 [Zingiber officinale]